MSTRFHLLALLLAASALDVDTASAQVATAIVRVGDAPSGAAPGVTVTSIVNTSPTELGGALVHLQLSNGHWAFWGSATSLGGAILREQQSGLSGYDPTAMEMFFGTNDAGAITYSPVVTELATGTTNLDSVWVDDQPVVVRGQPIPSLPGRKYDFASRPGLTKNGVLYWSSGIRDIATNADLGRGIFYGPNATVLWMTGDPAPAPLTATLDIIGVYFSYRFSRFASHNIAMLSTTDFGITGLAIAKDGVLATDAGGNILRGGDPLSSAAGALPGETWYDWNALGVNEAGDWMAGGRTVAAGGGVGVLMRNGVVIRRSGEVIQGLTLTGTVIDPGAFMNDAGDVAYAWGTSASGPAVFFDDALLLKPGDPVDFDGDGIVEPTSLFRNLVGIASLSLGNDHVFLAAVVEVNGVNKQCALAIELPGAARAFCAGDGSGAACPCGNSGAAGRGCANSTFASGARLVAAGTARVASGVDTLKLTATEIPGPGLFFQGSGTFGGGLGIPFGDGLLCAGGSIVRLGVVFPSGNEASFPGGLTPSPIHVAGAVAAGDVRHYQCWYRDAAAFCASATYNLTPGLTLTWAP